ncbi:MAG: sigma-54 dependent transcriptional regulator [Saprospiraceae bacterium]
MKTEGTILIVDDDEDISFSLKLLLDQHFSSVFTENNPYHIPRLLRQYSPDVILLDMNFKKGNTDGEEGIHWLKKIRELDSTVQVLMITAYSEVEVAVKTLKFGAADFLEKPWRNEKLLATVKSAFTITKSLAQVDELESHKKVLAMALDEPFARIIGTSSEMDKIYNTISKVANTDAHVLIMGENGSGKELVARAIHRQSKRHKEVFIPIDLGAIPESLFESELFGHKKGAFTDAYEDRIGRFEVSHKGTIFLDEIGNLSTGMQAKLLQVLQNKVIYRIGDPSPIQVNIRVICATNMPLYQMVEDKTFRQDLLYRINTIEINVPPLRVRKGDLPLLCDHFLSQLKKNYNRPDLTINSDSYKAMESYGWPGNVRELRHLLERAMILSDGDEIKPEGFIPSRINGDSSSESLNLDALEKKYILKALEINRGNITKASRDLGITRAALYRRLEKYGINQNEE